MLEFGQDISLVALMIIERFQTHIYMGNTCYDWSRLHGPSTHSAFVSV